MYHRHQEKIRTSALIANYVHEEVFRKFSISHRRWRNMKGKNTNMGHKNLRSPITNAFFGFSEIPKI
jgi:hypothetical protein